MKIKMLNVLSFILNVMPICLSQSVVSSPPLWLKVLSCSEGSGNDISAENRFTYFYNESTTKELASIANSIKIAPSHAELNPLYDNFVVMARPNSDAINALNDFSEVSFTKNENWIGSDTAKSRLSDTAIGTQRSFADYIYDGTGNEGGIHLVPITNDCEWDRNVPSAQDIEVYFGYYTEVVVTACYGWDYGSVSNSLQIQLKGSDGSSPFFFVNEYSSLPVHGKSATFYIAADIRGTVGDLHSVVITVDDPFGYCLKTISVNTPNRREYTFDSVNYFGSGIVLSENCQYSYKSILPNAALIRCIDDYLELYTYSQRGIYHVNAHTCVNTQSGISAMNMQDAVYSIIMGTSQSATSYSTSDITYLDHYDVGNVYLDKLGHLIGGNVLINEDINLYIGDTEGSIIGLKIEAIGHHLMKESFGERITIKIQDKDVMIDNYMVLENGKYLILFFDRIQVMDSTMSTQININIFEDTIMVYANVYVIFEEYNELYQLPFIIYHYNEGIDWFSANQICNTKYGTSLVSIHSKEEAFLIDGFLGNDIAWIGAVDFDLNDLMPNDINYNSDWKWIDASFIEFTNWISVQPDNSDNGKDCAYHDGTKDGWDSQDCQQRDISLFICASPFWYPNSHRKFEINVDCKINKCIDDIVLISIGNNDIHDSLCIDSVSVDDQVSVDISSNWIGGDSTQSSLNAIYRYPVCKTEVVDMRIDYSSSISYVIDDAYYIPGSECFNANRLLPSLCDIEQNYALPKTSIYGMLNNGGSSGKYSWASQSKVTLNTAESESIETTNQLKFLSNYAITYVDDNGRIKNIKPYDILTSTQWNDREQTDTSLGYATYFRDQQHRGWKTSFENHEFGVRKCQAKQDVPPSHSVGYNFAFNGLSLIVTVYSDLKLTLCDAFLNKKEENDDSNYAYIKNVPGEIFHFEPAVCNLRFESIRYIPNKLSCQEEQQLAISLENNYLPRCNQNDTYLYDGCQCHHGNGVCWCSDQEGNTLSGQAIKIPNDTPWQQVCIQDLNCANTDLANTTLEDW